MRRCSTCKEMTVPDRYTSARCPACNRIRSRAIRRQHPQRERDRQTRLRRLHREANLARIRDWSRRTWSQRKFVQRRRADFAALVAVCRDFGLGKRRDLNVPQPRFLRFLAAIGCSIGRLYVDLTLKLHLRGFSWSDYPGRVIFDHILRVRDFRITRYEDPTFRAAFELSNIDALDPLANVHRNRRIPDDPEHVRPLHVGDPAFRELCKPWRPSLVQTA